MLMCVRWCPQTHLCGNRRGRVSVVMGEKKLINWYRYKYDKKSTIGDCVWRNRCEHNFDN